MRGDSVDWAIAHFYESLYSEENETRPKPDRFMEELARGTVANSAGIDQRIEAKAANWRLERMPVVDRNILRLAIYEMLFCPEVPPVVAINEAIEIAKRFGAQETPAFVNGVLDRLLEDK